MYTVLLVDDEPVVLAMEKKIIRENLSDFEIIGEKFTVKSAIELYNTKRPDIILTDIRMPGCTGIELIKYIMETKNNESVILAVSGYTDFKYVHDAFTLGVYDYLLKPLEPAKIVEVFQKLKESLDEKKEKPSVAPDCHSASEEHHRVTLICKYIEENLDKDNSIVNICSKFGISQPQLSKLYKQWLGKTYNEYLTEARITEAKRLILQPDALLVGEVAEKVGFKDQFYFSKVFKSYTGYTPRDYRKQYLQPGNQ